MNIFKHGNCWELVKELEDNSVDCIATDPPYGITYNKWDKELDIPLFWKEFGRVVKPTGSIVMTANQPFTSKLVLSNLDWYNHCWVWEKSNITGFLDANRKPLKVHEDILVFWKGKKCGTYNPQGLIPFEKKWVKGKETKNYNYKNKPYIQQFKNYPKSVLKINHSNSNSLHPTQKPVPLFEYLIRTYTNEGDTVLDPFGGSGTTAVACIRTKRNFITYEQDETYFETMKKRIQLEQTKITLF